jgi:D-alanyl-D-alanine carboxypeptidase/D-alanyl-D-alanine-endopeptidase (penicillin-binding protein 4)
VVLLAVAAVLAVVKPGPVKGWLAFNDQPGAATATSAAPVDPKPTPLLKAAGADAPTPTAAGVKAAIGPLVKANALGSSVHVAVLDVATAQPLYQLGADTLTTPASTTKLLTAATVLAARGPAYRLTTRAVAGDEPGEVVLIGGGDPTMAVNAKGQFPGAARLDKLAAQVKKALGGTRPTKVVIDTSLYSGPTIAKGWSTGLISPQGQVASIQSLMTNAGRIKPVHHEAGPDPRYNDPALAAGKAFAKQLGVTAEVTRGKAPKVAAGASSAPGQTAAGTELGKVQSPPLVQILDWMLQQSDNVIAEAMGRQVALAGGYPASFDGASQAMIAKINDLGLPGDEVNLYDASGLSRHDGISPTVLTGVLAMAAGGDQPKLSSLFGGLPAWSGTLADRFAAANGDKVAQGVVRAKTGSLNAVSTMAGELVTKDGRLLAFAVMADQTSGGAQSAQAAIDAVVTRLVGCGC